ncbi:hypothetical protein E3N88_05267 [Mikania micrantha]|uniref:ZC3H15/TMA46 family C-terminal domain-containing protein n=1 Tax=Mikania micrantha TaxID=192012 RepID=A0A5N6PLB1_9ASTR|nr:hypothetical protein E3N88_05267 [Mikania micrantha]
MGEERHVVGDADKKLLTQAQFLSWKAQKEGEASAKKAEASRKREEDIAAGLVDEGVDHYGTVDVGRQVR